MKIENYRTYISEIPLCKTITLTKDDKIALLSIDNIPHILVRTRRELELRRTILKIRLKVKIEKDYKIDNIIKNLAKSNNINDIVEFLENDNLITICLYNDKAKVSIGKIISRNSGQDVWNIVKKGKIMDLHNIEKIFRSINIKLAL